MSSPNETLTEEFRRSGWLPANGDALGRWIKDKLELARKDPDAPLLPCIEDLQSMILNDSDMYMGFNRMFENATLVKSYEEMLILMNQILREAPTYGDVGPPFYMVLAEAMNTDGGFTAFMATELNEQFKRIFDDWTDFLISSYSTSTLTDEPGGWFSPDAIAAMSYGFDGLSFSSIFVCDPTKPHWGYVSWDDFFVRTLNPNVRTLELPDQPDVISAPCESIFYHTQTKVKQEDQFWIKGEPYSLRHMLKEAPDYLAELEGGTVFQGFLQITGYHRWHSPVDGEISKIITVPGTYFVQSPALLNSPPDHNPYLQSLAFVTSLTTRMLIFIQSSNSTIGMMCFVAVGLTEVSTCEATVQVGQHVSRGDELGMFHFGGSALCLVFGPGVGIKWEGSITEPGRLIKVRSAIGVASPAQEE